MPPDTTGGMPATTPTEELTGASGGTPPAGAAPAADQPADFETWLAQQPASLRQAYETHTAGLKSALEKERAANKKAKDEAAAAERQRKEAEMTELQRAQTALAELQHKLDAQAAEFNAHRVQLAVQAEASKLDFASPTDAYHLLTVDGSLAGVVINEEGKVSGFEEALKTLAKSKRLPLKSEGRGGDGLGTPPRKTLPQPTARGSQSRRVMPL